MKAKEERKRKETNMQNSNTKLKTPTKLQQTTPPKSTTQQINPSTPITTNHLKQTENITTNQPNFQQ